MKIIKQEKKRKKIRKISKEKLKKISKEKLSNKKK